MEDLQLVDYMEGNFESEKKANNEFYEKNEGLLMNKFYNKWVIIAKGGRLIDIYGSCKSLLSSIRLIYNPYWKSAPKLCWQLTKLENSSIPIRLSPRKYSKSEKN